MFLVATLYCGQASNPVRVRNLSATGALVEGASLPPTGTAVILRRGALEAPGTAVWSRSGKAGLAFDGQVDVAAWLPVKEAKAQTQVDQIAFGIKHARAAAPVAPPALVQALSIEAALAELDAVQMQIRQIGGKLALDAAVVASHPDVQLLDAAGRRIGRLVDAILSAKA